ncbi:MAG: PAS domain S-box protein, partial [Comamonadaceae bacterium]
MNSLPLETPLGEQRLLAALAAAGTGVWTWDIASDAVSWTPECYQIFGVADQGQPLRLETFTSLIHPDDAASVQEQVGLALEGGQPMSVEFRIRRADGQVRWLVNDGRSEPGPDGRPARMSGTVRDITEQKHVELRGRESQDRLNLTVEASGMGLWTWDLATGAVTWTSQCYAIHGLREGEMELTADAFFRLVHPADRDRVRHTVTRAIHANEPY